MTHDFYKLWVEEVCKKAELVNYTIDDYCKQSHLNVGSRCPPDSHRFVIDSSFSCIVVRLVFAGSVVKLYDEVGSGPGSFKKLSMADPECEIKAARFICMAEPYGRGY